MNPVLEATASFSARRRLQGALHAVAGVVAVAALVVMANYLADRYAGRWFLSTQTELRLAPQTLSVLRTLTNDVTVTVFYDRQDPFFTTVMALLREYQLAKPRLRVQAVDYLRDGGAAQQVFSTYKLAGVTNKNLIIFACGTNVMRVDGNALVQYTMQRTGNRQVQEYERKPVAFYGEKAFTVALLTVANPKPLKACFLAGHEEHDPGSSHETQGYAKFEELLRQNCILTLPLSLTGTNTVPDDCNLLIVAGPLRPIPDAELEKIDQYLTQGGRLLALFNSYSTPRQCGLENVLSKWGLEVSTPAVEDRANTVSGHDIKVSRFGAHPVVQPLSQSPYPSALHLWMPRAVARCTAAVQGVEVQELARSSEASSLAGSAGGSVGSLPLIAAVEKGAVKGVLTGRTTRIVVAGDSFFLGNQLIESASNAEFAAYAINWLLDRSQLLHGLGPKPVTEFRLVLSASQMRLLRWLLLGGLPGAILLFGGLVWLRRRS
jgi:ABC-type uncharacterized transport system involved in gliding motility auxiliary subunit